MTACYKNVILNNFTTWEVILNFVFLLEVGVIHVKNHEPL